MAQWKIEAKKGNGEWTIIEEGGSPKSKETVINGNYDASMIRLTAESPEDWIGAYELALVGRPL